MRHLVGAATSLAHVLPILVHNFLILDPDRLHATGQTRLVPTPSSSPQGILLLACACLPVPAGAALGLPPPWAIPWFLFAIAKTFGAVNDIIGVSMLFPPPHYPLPSLDCTGVTQSAKTPDKNTRQLPIQWPVRPRWYLPCMARYSVESRLSLAELRPARSTRVTAWDVFLTRVFLPLHIYVGSSRGTSPSPAVPEPTPSVHYATESWI